MNLAKTSFKAFGIKIIGAVLITAYSIFLARILSQEDYGTVMFAIVVATALGPLCLLGFDRTTTKFAAIYYAEKQVPQLRGLLSRGRRTGLSFSLALLLLGGTLAALGVLDLAVSKEKAVFLALCILPLWAWVLLNREFQRGLKLLTPALVGFQILRPGLAMLFTAAAYMLGSQVGSTSALAYLGGALAIIVVNDARQINKALGPASGKLIYETDKWLQAAKPLLFSVVMNTIIMRADILMVGAMLGMEEAARYSVASRLANIPDFILDAARLVIAPLISEHFHRNKLDVVQSQVTKISQLIFLTVAPFSLAILLFPEFFLGLFGKMYASADTILIYLIAGQIVNGFSGTVGVLLIMTNLQKQHACIVSVGAAANLILVYWLVKKMGAEGAALATAITIMLTNVCMIIIAKRKLQIVSYVRFNRNFLGYVKKAVRRRGEAR